MWNLGLSQPAGSPEFAPIPFHQCTPLNPLHHAVEVKCSPKGPALALRVLVLEAEANASSFICLSFAGHGVHPAQSSSILAQDPQALVLTMRTSARAGTPLLQDAPDSRQSATPGQSLMPDPITSTTLVFMMLDREHGLPDQRQARTELSARCTGVSSFG